MPLEDEVVSSPAVVRVDDDDGMVEWTPLEVSEGQRLGLPSDVHSSVREYLSSFWFLALGGRRGGDVFQLEAVPGPAAIEEYCNRLADYRSAHSDGEFFAPLGFETESGQIVVVERESGEVFLEATPGPRRRIASSVAELVSGLEV